ncbi:MAG: transcription elongation factor GreA [Candidatus Endonucleobacter bathymodioli]|uniref:Transcription elongation factor GreA n=1 Tax=Candidatus Endonucleibacter bathymodioli TaxID=539814 RepID=A0AA90ST74_9GAMM|nr:transcription elongation factor GreA [Candidatus Endonucleobacter bathymodioli]
MNRVPMTIEGEKNLREELAQLKSVKRPQISQAIAEARELGDLKENAEYHTARDEQGFVEARIKDIEAKLSLAQVIDISTIKEEGRVIFGSTVQLVNRDDAKNVSYRIVGDDEADLKDNKISVHSPIARALVGKEEGDIVVVITPSGKIEYEIGKVRHI